MTAPFTKPGFLGLRDEESPSQQRVLELLKGRSQTNQDVLQLQVSLQQCSNLCGRQNGKVSVWQSWLPGLVYARQENSCGSGRKKRVGVNCLRCHPREEQFPAQRVYQCGIAADITLPSCQARESVENALIQLTHFRSRIAVMQHGTNVMKVGMSTGEFG